VSSGAPVAVQPVPRGGLGRLVGRRAVDWLPALAVLIGIVALWQGLIVWTHAQQFLLPKPTSIASAFWTDKHELWSAGWYTFQEALGGFVLGSGLAILLALVLARWRPLGAALLPYAVAANAIPIIAFAPIARASSSSTRPGRGFSWSASSASPSTSRLRLSSGTCCAGCHRHRNDDASQSPGRT
jgi:hypothetical protein